MSAQRFVTAPTWDVFDLLLIDEEVSGGEYIRSIATSTATGEGLSSPGDWAADESGTNASRSADKGRQQVNLDWMTNGALLANDVVVDGPRTNTSPPSSQGGMAVMTGPFVEHADEDNDVTATPKEQQLWHQQGCSAYTDETQVHIKTSTYHVQYQSVRSSASELDFGEPDNRADNVRILARSINRAAAKVEESYTNAVVIDLTQYFTLSNLARDVYDSFVWSLNQAVAAINFDEQVAFVVRVGRSLMAQSRESSKLIKTYFSRYAQSQFGYRLKADTVRDTVIPNDETAID